RRLLRRHRCLQSGLARGHRWPSARAGCRRAVRDAVLLWNRLDLRLIFGGPILFMNRRKFFNRTAAATTTLAFYGAVRTVRGADSPNSTIRVAVMGLGRGLAHVA